MLWGKYDTVILDLDGVVYIGNDAVPHAIQSIKAIQNIVRVTAATNNAARRAAVVVDHLKNLGLNLREVDIVTSAQVGARMLADLIPAGSQVLAVGGEGVAFALEEVGLTAMQAPRDLSQCATVAASVKGILQGHGNEVCWWDLTTAAFAIQQGALWVATNQDQTLPTPYGLAVGEGSMVAALEFALEKSPQVGGKPGPELFLETIRRAGSKSALVIGDRLDTDVDGAIAAGLDSLLVSTGVHGLNHVLERPIERRPTYFADDLRVLTAAAAPVWPASK